MKRTRYELLALILVIAVIATLLMFTHPDRNHTDTRPELVVRTSYGTIPSGYGALYLTLKELGYPVVRQTRPYPLLPKHGLLIVADPDPGAHHPEVTSYEARRLHDWVRAGNYALVLVEYHPENLPIIHQTVKPTRHDPKENALMKALSDPGTRWTEQLIDGPGAVIDATPTFPSFISARVPTIQVKSTVDFPADALLPPDLAKQVGGAVPLYRDDYGVVASYSAMGKGGIVWCSSPWSFSNEGLTQPGNLEFILALADRQPGAPVIFDEYHHGYGAGMSVWTVAPSLTKWGIAECVLALVLLFVTVAWRFGPTRLPAEERYTRSRAEYLTSMAALLHHARATHVARERLNILLRRQLGKRLGIHPQASYEQFLAANAANPVVNQSELERVVRHLTALEQQQRPDADTLVRLAGDIQRLLHKKVQ